MFQPVTKHPSFDQTPSQPSIETCVFNVIYALVRGSLMMRLIDLMAPEMRSVRPNRQKIPERRQTPPLRSASRRLERSVSKGRIKKLLPVIHLIHNRDAERESE